MRSGYTGDEKIICKAPRSGARRPNYRIIRTADLGWSQDLHPLQFIRCMWDDVAPTTLRPSRTLIRAEIEKMLLASPALVGLALDRTFLSRSYAEAVEQLGTWI